MNEKYRPAFELGQRLMNEYRMGSWHYERGQKILAWACAKNRGEQQVQLQVKKQKDDNGKTNTAR